MEDLVRVTSANVLKWQGPDEVRPILEVTEAQPGDLYFAMRSASVNLNSLKALRAAHASGVVIFSGQAPPEQSFESLGVLSVESPPLAFFALAAEARRRIRALVVGITGTSGKSATKEFVAAALSGHYDTVKTVDSLNRISDIATVLLKLNHISNQAAVLEMGFGQIGDIERMSKIARPDIGVITNVTMAHLDGAQGSWETVASEKGKIAKHISPKGALVLNADDLGCQRVNHDCQDCRVFTFGVGRTAMVRVQDVQVEEQGTDMELSVFGKKLRGKIQAVGRVQALNAAAALLVAHLAGVPLTEAFDRIGAVSTLSRRFEIHRFDQSLTIIDDTFSASPDAMTRGLACAGDLGGNRRKLAVLSDIVLLGDHSSEKHRAIGKAAAESGFSNLILFGDNGVPDIRAGALEAGLPPESICVTKRRSDLLPAVLVQLQPKTLIYCKARQGLWIGPVVDELRKVATAQGFSPLSVQPQ